ncbi:hypothetical protein [Streptomyces sp. NPDC008150]|uniref:hypothetical protein n=1 Tax=Streptomyces sp. NPDC008150 TaxID=3364816 RepID=UPI0036E06E4E
MVDPAANAVPGPAPASPQESPAAAGPPAAEAPGLLSTLAGLAGHSGAADERLGAERDAIRGLQVGQLVGGSIYNMVAGPASIRMYRLSTEELHETREAFVRPPDWTALRRSTLQRSVTLLRGPRGGGKYALARDLLLDAGHRTLFLLDPDTDLSVLGRADLQQGAGYLLTDFANAGALTGFELSRLEHELRYRQARLIVTVEQSATRVDPGTHGHLLDATRRAAGPEIVSAQVAWRLGIGADGRVKRLMARPDVIALLRELLSGAPAGRAAELGQLVAEAAEANADDEVVARVRTRLALRDGDSLATWFENLGDLARQCLAVSVAIFGGEAYASVAALAHDLEERLQVKETAEHPDRARGTALIGSTSGRLAAIQATLVTSAVATRYGGAQGQVVRFRDQGVSARVLEHVWTEYDRVRLVLPDWLRDCAVNESQTLRVRAAVAAGTLAKQYFETVRARILRPWAASDRAELRDAAAVAVRVAAVESGHAQAAHALVRSWSFESNTRLRATAARAWRVVFELDGTEAAWSLLHDLADTDRDDVIDAVCRSLTEYMALEQGHYYRDALDLIDQWCGGGGHGARRSTVGEIAFLYAAADLVERRGPGAGPDTTRAAAHPGGPFGGSGGKAARGRSGGQNGLGTIAPPGSRPATGNRGPRVWPMLLAAADRDDVRRQEVALLWMRTVNSPRVYEAAHEVLAEWARLAEPDPVARVALGRLLAVAAADVRTERILRKQADTWIAAGEGRGAPLAGQEVITHLGRKPR